MFPNRRCLAKKTSRTAFFRESFYPIAPSFSPRERVGYGKPARPLKAGDVVNIPANVKHWHGAAKDGWFQHIAIELPGEDNVNEWCERVEDEYYDNL